MCVCVCVQCGWAGTGSGARPGSYLSIKLTGPVGLCGEAAPGTAGRAVAQGPWRPAWAPRGPAPKSTWLPAGRAADPREWRVPNMAGGSRPVGAGLGRQGAPPGGPGRVDGQPAGKQSAPRQPHPGHFSGGESRVLIRTHLPSHVPILGGSGARAAAAPRSWPGRLEGTPGPGGWSVCATRAGSFFPGRRRAETPAVGLE